MLGLLQQEHIHSGTFCANLPGRKLSTRWGFLFFFLFFFAPRGHFWFPLNHTRTKSPTLLLTQHDRKTDSQTLEDAQHHGRILFSFFICQRMSDRGHTVSCSSHTCLCSPFTAPLIKLFYSVFSTVCRCHQLKTKSATAGCVKTALFWT